MGSMTMTRDDFNMRALMDPTMRSLMSNEDKDGVSRWDSLPPVVKEQMAEAAMKIIWHALPSVLAQVEQNSDPFAAFTVPDTVAELGFF